MTRRVAITGVGLVTPVGNDVASTWSALLAARSGAAPIRSFDASGFPVRIAAEVKDLPLAAVEDAAGDRKLVKLANRSHRFALVAAEQAFADAGIRPTAKDATRWGTVVGTGMMGVTGPVCEPQSYSVARPPSQTEPIGCSAREARRRTR
jgi:3-oxoacyl-(acyl-carrier-protein) synthase